MPLIVSYWLYFHVGEILLKKTKNRNITPIWKLWEYCQNIWGLSVCCQLQNESLHAYPFVEVFQMTNFTLLQARNVPCDNIVTKVFKRQSNPSFCSIAEYLYQIETLTGSSGGVVVKLSACGARSLGFNFRSRCFNFRDWLSPASIGYLLLPSRDMAERLLKRRKSSKTTNKRDSH